MASVVMKVAGISCERYHDQYSEFGSVEGARRRHSMTRNDVTIKNALASIAVKDLAAAVRWYEQVLGKPPDSRPMPEVAEWKFERGGWLQVYMLPERAGAGSVTLA